MALLKSLRNLNKFQTLLLLGGAFGFVALVAWYAWAYRPMLDPTSSAPADAIVAVSLRQILPERVASVLPADLVAAVAGGSAYATRSTLGTIKWHPLAGSGKWRLVNRDVGAVGFVLSAGKNEPFSVAFSENGVALRVGRGFRGLNLGAALGRPRLIRSFPKESYLYISDLKTADTGRIMNVGILADLMSKLPGRTELVLAHHAGDKLQPFIIVETPGTKRLNMSDIDRVLGEEVGKLDPSSRNIVLPDNSKSKELRSSTPNVEVVSRQIGTGLIRRFIGPSGKLELNYFLSNDGSLWISNHIEILQGFISSGADLSLEYPACADLTDPFTTVIHPKAESAVGTEPEWINKWASGFDSVVFSLKQAETGLFTLCGYLN